MSEFWEIFIGTTLIIGFLVALVLGVHFSIESDYREKCFNKLKINDRYILKDINNPFLSSDKNIAVILGKEQSSVDNKYYVLFASNKVKYSCDWKLFLKKWKPVSKKSLMNDYEIDTNFSGEYKDFRESYKYIDKRNNKEVEEWEEPLPMSWDREIIGN